MAIDPSIALAIRPVDTATPINGVAQQLGSNAATLFGANNTVNSAVRQNTQDALAQKQLGVENQFKTQQLGIMQQQANTQASEAAVRNALIAQETLKAHWDSLDAEDKHNFTSTAMGALQLKPMVDSAVNAIKTGQDPTPFIKNGVDFLEQRRAEIKSRGGNSAETDHALSALQSGDPQQIQSLNDNIGGILLGGQMLGVLPTKPNEPLSPGGKIAYDKQHGFLPNTSNGGIPIAELPDATTRKAALDEQNIVLSSPDVISNLVRARAIVPNTFETGLVSARQKMSLSRGTGIDQSALKNTADYENIIERQVVAQMKTLFTRPTEYETKLVQKIEGSIDSSITERQSILNEAINYLQQRDQQARDSLDSLGVNIKEPTKRITGDQRNNPGGQLPANIGAAATPPDMNDPGFQQFLKSKGIQ